MDDEWDFEDEEVGNEGAPTEEYRVGYKKPPRETQWKKGQSGHPGGRPRGSKDFGKIFRQHANEKVTVRIDGKERKVSITDAALIRVMRDAAAGHPRAVDQVIKMLQRYGQSEQRAEEPCDFSALTCFELDMYGRLATVLVEGKEAFWKRRRDDQRADQKRYNGRPNRSSCPSFETEQRERAQKIFTAQLAALKAEDEEERQAAIDAGELEYYFPQPLLSVMLAAERGGILGGTVEPDD